MLKSLLNFFIKKYLKLNLCNRKKCYRVVNRKNGVCSMCKNKSKVIK